MKMAPHARSKSKFAASRAGAIGVSEAVSSSVPLAQLSPRGQSASTKRYKNASNFSNPSPTPCPCQIYLNNAPITSSNQNVLCGQQIVLSLSCGSFTPTNISWSIPGPIFLSWNPSLTSATVTPVTNTTSPQITFFWKSSNTSPASYNVSVTYTGSDGSSQCTATATLIVTTPSWTLEADVGPITVWTFEGTQVIGPTPTPPGIRGVYISSVVNIPSGLPSPGQYQYLQLVSPSGAFRQLAVGGCQALLQNGVTPPVLDTDGTSYWMPSSLFNTNTGFETDVGDDPSIQGSPYVANKGTFAFVTYLMFLPPSLSGNASQWVPLSAVKWGYVACGTGGPSNWVLSAKSVPNSPNPSYGSQQSNHPTWSARTNTTYVSSSCPSPFCS